MITKNGTALARKLAPSLPAPARGSLAVAELCSLIARHTVTHGRLSTLVCNGGDSFGAYARAWSEDRRSRARTANMIYAKKKIPEIEKLVTALCERLSAAAGCEIKPIFDDDPRGVTIKLRVPDGRSDNFGGEGICALG